ncbi:ABC-type Fe3+-hydroxamate transport system substrate-binding protein [Paenibacillus amylolyticus]|uniref:ABC-type Fe3+-hydroxamate transport system substrate-binding protein n=1 Tax=Paenibacillus amylolyticus TaxID=1451 RepID=A0AAP5H0Q4_PAEAM|nr:AraC family transcriptional regulator [Paenibacillus amylolyticus]MDR6722623.1 ABC-type Fe3+-hydroxamate transport system substrate-binding protein [Paenibacillus amylolyticus]
MNLELNYGVLFRDWTIVLKDAVQIKLLTGETHCSDEEIAGKPGTNSGVQFILGVSGEGEISLGQDTRSFRPHDLFLVEEGQAVAVINRELSPLVCYIIHCQRVSLLQGLAPEKEQLDNQNKTGVLELCNSVNLQHMAIDDVKQIVESFQREDLHDPLWCHLLFHKWMCAIVEQLRRKAELQQPNLAIQRTIDYLDEHYDDPITVQQLAKMANVSRKWYTMRFREITNQNPRDYITELRIKRAKELLNLTGDSLYEIARKVGYEDEHYFSRRFKQMVGHSPRLYLHHRRYSGTTMTSPELLYTLGMTPIVAKAPFSEFPHYLKESFKQVRKWESGYSLDMDEIRGLKPDLIIASAWQDDQHYEQLNRIATTVLLPERNNWREELKDLGEVLGRNKQAQQVISKYNERLNQAREQLHRLISNETIIYIRLTSEGINLYGEKSSRGNTLYRELDLKMPNASFLYGEGMLITVEILAQIQPDHILLQMEDSMIAQRALYDHPMWNQLLAVQNNQVHVLSNREWYNFSFSPLATQYAIQELLDLLTQKRP